MLRFVEKEIAKEKFYTAKRHTKIYDVNVSSGEWSNLGQSNKMFLKRIYSNKIFKLIKNLKFFLISRTYQCKKFNYSKIPKNSYSIK